MCGLHASTQRQDLTDTADSSCARRTTATQHECLRDSTSVPLYEQ